MSKPKYLLTIKKNDYAQCRGNHLVEILQIINVKAQNITWYSSDVEITGTDAYRLGLHGWIPKRVGKTEDLISVSKRVDQFLSGVFLAMPRDLGKELQVEIATEDKSFRDISDAILEIRAFDTSYFEIYSNDLELINYLSKHYSVRIEINPEIPQSQTCGGM